MSSKRPKRITISLTPDQAEIARMCLLTELARGDDRQQPTVVRQILRIIKIIEAAKAKE